MQSKKRNKALSRFAYESNDIICSDKIYCKAEEFSIDEILLKIYNLSLCQKCYIISLSEHGRQMQLKEALQTYWYNDPAIFIVDKCVALVTTFIAMKSRYDKV